MRSGGRFSSTGGTEIHGCRSSPEGFHCSPVLVSCFLSFVLPVCSGSVPDQFPLEGYCCHRAGTHFPCDFPAARGTCPGRFFRGHFSGTCCLTPTAGPAIPRGPAESDRCIGLDRRGIVSIGSPERATAVDTNRPGRPGPWSEAGNRSSGRRQRPCQLQF